MHTQWKQDMKDKRLFPSLFALKKNIENDVMREGNSQQKSCYMWFPILKMAYSFTLQCFFIFSVIVAVCYLPQATICTCDGNLRMTAFCFRALLFISFFLLCFFISFSLKFISFDIIYGHHWRDMRLDGCCFFCVVHVVVVWNVLNLQCTEMTLSVGRIYEWNSLSTVWDVVKCRHKHAPYTQHYLPHAQKFP